MAVEAAVLWRICAYQISEWPRHWKERGAFFTICPFEDFFLSLCLSSYSYFSSCTVHTANLSGVLWHCLYHSHYFLHNVYFYIPIFGSIISLPRPVLSTSYLKAAHYLVTKSNLSISGSSHLYNKHTFVAYIVLIIQQIKTWKKNANLLHRHLCLSLSFFCLLL